MRKNACNILNRIETKGEFSHEVLQNYLTEHPELSAVDRRFLTRLVRGVLENKLLLDYAIRKYSKQRFSRIDIRVVNALRIGFYQLMFLDKIPESAAVNESVKIAKIVNNGQGAFVNGILRAFIRDGKSLQLPDKKHLVTRLSVAYSHPEWLVDFWLKAYGSAFTEDLLKANNAVPPLTVRVNTSQIEVAEFCRLLDASNVTYEVSKWCETILTISQFTEGNLQSLVGFEEGYFQIQDLASAMVGHLATVKESARVLDVCSAPGGKATHIAQKLNGSGRVLARDVSEKKLDLVNQNIKRLKLSNIETELQDALVLTESEINQNDLVLVDAPCSGLGIIRRKPDIKYNKTPEDLKALKEIQQNILNIASQYVKMEGELLYSTCTLNKAENEVMIEQFLKNNKNFECKPFVIGDEEVASGMYTFFPNVHGTDGFFIAKLIKKGEDKTNEGHREK